MQLITHKESCDKVQEKYKLYIDNELYPLIEENQKYLKNAITILYDNKLKELTMISKKIDDIISAVHINNGLYTVLFMVSFGMCLFAIMLAIFVLYNPTSQSSQVIYMGNIASG